MNVVHSAMHDKNCCVVRNEERYTYAWERLLPGETQIKRSASAIKRSAGAMKRSASVIKRSASAMERSASAVKRSASAIKCSASATMQGTRTERITICGQK